MAATSAPTAKANLLALLKADASLSAIPSDTLTIAWARPSAPTEQMIYFGKTKATEDAVSLGNNRRDERYRVELVIDVALDGDDGQTVEQSMWTLAQYVEHVVASNVNLTGAVTSALVKTWDATPGTGPGVRFSAVVYEIECFNRKSP